MNRRLAVLLALLLLLPVMTLAEISDSGIAPEESVSTAVDEAVPELGETDLVSLIEAEESEIQVVPSGAAAEASEAEQPEMMPSGAEADEPETPVELSEVATEEPETELPAPGLTPGEEMVFQPPEAFYTVEGGESGDELFAAYVNRLFYDRRSVRLATAYAGEQLSGQDRVVYDTLKPEIIRVAEGSRSSTEIGVPLVSLIGRSSFSAAELGVTMAYDEDGGLDAQCVSALWTAFYDNIQVNVGAVSAALWYDCTYELYWFDRYQYGLGSQKPGVSLRYDAALGDYVVRAADDAQYMFRFSVMSKYAADTYAVDPGRIEGAKRAAQNAKAIVRKYADDSDYAKLYGYAVEICKLAGYNYDAIAPGWSMSEQNPWHLIWVFDGDPGTSVVCEGYAQAFQYLCELTDFDGDIRCYIVDGVASENHAWNVVRMDDGANYVVDVTWMDGDWVDRLTGGMADWISDGAGCGLFLAGAGSGSVNGGYDVAYRGGASVSRRAYSANTLNAYPASMLKLAGTEYIPTGFMKIAGSTYYFDGSGRYVTGSIALDGLAYDFDSDGKLSLVAATGWRTIGGKRYYFDENGLHTSHTPETVAAVPPSCTASGLTEGSRCSVCGTVIVEQQAVQPLGHQWGEPSYTWNDDGSATAVHICERDGNHLERETVNPSAEVALAPTCETKGSTTYTATFSNEAFQAQIRTLDDIDALGHRWGAAEYTWDGNASVTARRTCARDANHVETETVNTASRVSQNPTCEAMGWTTYTASFANSAFQPQSRTAQDVEALGHSWGDASYAWAADNGSVTARRACLRDAGHVQTERALVTSEVTRAASCEIDGEITGVAEFNNGAFQTQRRVIDSIPATGHSPVILPAVAATYFSDGLTEGSYCQVCGAVLEAQRTVPALPIPQATLKKQKGNGTVTVRIGEPLQIIPQFATSKGWTVKSYKSGRSKVASVNGSGLVTAKAEGKATITVTTKNRKKATITVKVVDPFKPTGVRIDQGKSVTLNLGQTLQLDANLAPATARSALTWSSNRSKVASVNGDGLVTAKAEGTARITVTTRNKKKATITVKVVDPFKPTGVKIVQGKSATLRVGETLQLSAGMSPVTAQSALKWKSSKKKVATVDANGLVTAKKKGTAKITVTTWNGKKAVITIRVK